MRGRWPTPEGYVRASFIREVAVTLQIMKLIDHPITIPTLNGWASGLRSEGQSNQPTYHRFPFPVPRDELRKNGVFYLYPEKYLFIIIAWHAAMMKPGVDSGKLARKLESAYKRHTAEK